MKTVRTSVAVAAVTTQEVVIGGVGDTVLEDAVWTILDIQADLPGVASVTIHRDNGDYVRYEAAE